MMVLTKKQREEIEKTVEDAERKEIETTMVKFGDKTRRQMLITETERKVLAEVYELVKKVERQNKDIIWDNENSNQEAIHAISQMAFDLRSKITIAIEELK